LHGGSNPQAIRKARQGEDYAPTGQSDYRKGRAFSAEIEHDRRPTELTDAAREWQGYGTALKPATEPICLARKPISESSIAANVLKWGTGALNIDGCRIATDGEEFSVPQSDPSKRSGAVGSDLGISKADTDKFQAAQRASIERTAQLGRWPANLIHDGSDEVVAGFPESDGAAAAVGPQYGPKSSVNAYGDWGPRQEMKPRGDSGSAARFFYCAKATTEERGEGNNHPTVKPVELMCWLVRLVTPSTVWYCPSCEGTADDSSKAACGVTPVRDVSGDIQASRQPACRTVLQSDLRGEGEAGAAEEVRALRNGVPAGQAKQSVLQPHLFGNGDRCEETQSGWSDYGEGLCDDPSAGASHGESRGLCHGTSSGHGAGVGQESDSERSRPPHQREEGRQSAGESAADAQEASRQAPEAKAQADPLSPLQRNDRGERTCPTCSGALSRRAGVVLDPFMGSGSTALACDAEQFDFIGCELSADYAVIAEKRVRDAAGMFADISVEHAPNARAA
jgi:hypothetical protein